MIFLKNTKIRSIIVSLVLASSLFAGIGFTLPTKGEVQAAVIPEYPFGGRVLYWQFCSCTPGCFNIIVGRPRPAALMWCPTTVTYMYYNIFRAWQLGVATGFVPCLEIGEPCEIIGGGLLMIMDGTSLY
jgi:hypothetical protein